MKGENLETLINRFKKTDTYLDESVVIDILHQLALGTYHLSLLKIVHYNIKPR
jgi:hypothetical protein